MRAASPQTPSNGGKRQLDRGFRFENGDILTATMLHAGLGLGPMVYRLLFESSAELIRLTDTPTRLATDSGE